ncbi:hypothetical protein [Fluviicola sp.]|uniref:hypothetical protein n=1 Tax=Fluviicola sp. TaxID=1917219 RepID=UPI002628C62B|nr:hypothetical protein [Fluviicola sp.]
MKLLLLRVSLTLLVAQASFPSFGQSVTQQLNPEEIANRISYVYGHEFVLNNPTLVAAYGDVMTHRIEYRVIGQTPDEKYPLLSTFPLYTKVNETIQGVNAENFDVNAFNPLVYMIEFFSDKAQLIRIDNTNYVMVIHPINY